MRVDKQRIKIDTCRQPDETAADYILAAITSLVGGAGDRLTKMDIKFKTDDTRIVRLDCYIETAPEQAPPADKSKK